MGTFEGAVTWRQVKQKVPRQTQGLELGCGFLETPGSRSGLLCFACEPPLNLVENFGRY